LLTEIGSSLPSLELLDQLLTVSMEAVSTNEVRVDSDFSLELDLIGAGSSIFLHVIMLLPSDERLLRFFE